MGSKFLNMTDYMKCPEKASPQRQSRLVVAWGWEWEWGLTIRGQEGSYWHDENILKLVYGAGLVTW